MSLGERCVAVGAALAVVAAAGSAASATDEAKHTSAAGTKQVQAARAKLPVYRTPGYKGSTKVPRTRPAPLPRPVQLTSSGRYPDVLVDDAGTAHIVWTEDNGAQADTVHYCRLKRAATTCDARAELVANKPYGPGDDPEFNVSQNGARILRIGQQLVIIDFRYPTTYPKPDGSDPSRTVLMWVSYDGGQSFSGPAIVGNQEISGGAVVFGPENDPTIVTTTDTVTGGTFVQAIQPGQFTSASGNLGTGGPDRAYSGNLAVDAGVPVAAFADLNNTTYVRRWSGNGSPADPATWGPPLTVAGDEPQLAGGPSGLFLLNRPRPGAPYAVRRIAGGQVGRSVAVSPANASLRSFYASPSGRLFAAWQEGAGGTGAKVELRSSADGRSWGDPQPLVTGSANGQIRIGAAADGGGFAVLNHTGGINQYGILYALGFGPRAPTGKRGLAGLPGGGTDAVTSCQTVRFGVARFDTKFGCFLAGSGSARGSVVTSGELDLNGLRVVPEAGTKIVIDPRARTIDTAPATGAVRVLLEYGSTSITLWRGAIHAKLPSAGPGSTLFSFDTGAFGVDVLGFAARGRIDVLLAQDSVRVPVSLQLPKIFGDVRGAAQLVGERGRGLRLDSLAINVGNAFLGPLLIKRIEIEYTGSQELWRGAATVQFPPPALGGSLGGDVEFQGGAYKRGGFAYEPPPPGIVIGPFVYLNRIGGRLDLDPTHIQASARVGAGTPAVGGVSPINVVGTFDMTFPSPPRPVTFAMNGRVTFFIFEIGRGFLRFTGDGTATFGGHVGLDLGPLRVRADADGFVDARRGEFGASLSGETCIALKLSTPVGTFDAGCVGVGTNAAISTAGFAACAGVNVPLPFSTFTGKRITGGVEVPARDLEPALLVNPATTSALLLAHLRFPCNTGPYRKPPPAAVSKAAGPGSVAVRIGRGLPSATLAVVGRGGAPRVSVTGPGGKAVGFGVNAAGVPATYVVIPKPAAGAYTVTPQPGSPAIAEVSVGAGYRPAQVRARLGRRGGKRTIAYRVANTGSGQEIVFLERGAFGSRLIARTRKSRGTIRFTPFEARGTRRTVVAQVRREGLVHDERVVGRFRAPHPARPGRVPHLRVKRRGRTLTVTFGPARGAVQYLVWIRGSHGRRELKVLSARQRRVRTRILASGDRLTVRVAARSRLGLVGPAASVRR